MRADQATGTALGERIGGLQVAHGAADGPWALPVFCGNVLERAIVQRQIGDHLLELAVLVFQVP